MYGTGRLMQAVRVLCDHRKKVSLFFERSGRKMSGVRGSLSQEGRPVVTKKQSRLPIEAILCEDLLRRHAVTLYRPLAHTRRTEIRKPAFRRKSGPRHQDPVPALFQKRSESLDARVIRIHLIPPARMLFLRTVFYFTMRPDLPHIRFVRSAFFLPKY